MIDIAKGPAEAFGPLKAVLGSISTLLEKYQVCFCVLCLRSLSDNPICRMLLMLRTRLKYFNHASMHWRSFLLSSLQVMRRK